MVSKRIKHYLSTTLPTLLLLICIMLTLTHTAIAVIPDKSEYSQQFIELRLAPRDNREIASALNSLGVLAGSDKGFELERTPTRIEALVTAIRLTGKEDEALSSGMKHTFSDVPDWADSYAGYAQTNGLIQGVGNGLMGATDDVTAPQYVTMMLRTLGYSDINGDFTYSKALSFAYNTGLLDNRDLEYYSANNSITRNDMVYFMYRTLACEQKDSTAPLIWELVCKEVLDAKEVCGLMLEKGESDTEMKRALKNGYFDIWVRDIHALIDDNTGIPAEYKPTFKDCIYNWLKEAGNERSIKQFKNKVYSLQVRSASKENDPVFDDDYVMAYYRSPNQIVIRDDIRAESIRATLVHEFRHAMSSTLSLTLLEEGVTDFWSQEVDFGEYGYPYFYVNCAKLLTHFVGARTLNHADLDGSYESLIYELERNTGVHINKNLFHDILSGLNYSNYIQSSIDRLTAEFLKLVEGYYKVNFAGIVSKSANYEEYIETIVALGQLLYYPSASVLDTDSETINKMPSSFYTTDYSTLVYSLLTQYSSACGISFDTLNTYYDSVKDTRISIKYLGPDSSNIFVKKGVSYRAVYSVDGYNYYKDFGVVNALEDFKTQVDIVRVIEIPDGAFIKRLYD